MGNEENDWELVAGNAPTEPKQAVVEKEPQVELLSEPPPSEDNDSKASKGPPGDSKGDGGASAAASPMDKAQKSSPAVTTTTAATTRWSKIQNWRKALSEDLGDRPSSSSSSAAASPGKSGPGVKPEKAPGVRKNPFRRALSEPTGSLFAALTSSSSGHHANPSTATSDAAPPADASQRGGGGALLRKCLKTVSQKLKRPRLPSRHSTHNLLPDVDESPSSSVPAELQGHQWAPPQEVPLWDISNCILEEGQILICPEDEPVMWTRNRVSSCLSNLSVQNLTAEINTECSPDPVGQGGGARFKTQDGGVK
ncbi:hypothetical protein CRUP_010329, partial [Coryphaenoides rupestris]